MADCSVPSRFSINRDFACMPSCLITHPTSFLNHHSYPQQHNSNSIVIGIHCVVFSSRWVLAIYCRMFSIDQYCVYRDFVCATSLLNSFPLIPCPPFPFPQQRNFKSIPIETHCVVVCLRWVLVVYCHVFSIDCNIVFFDWSQFYCASPHLLTHPHSFLNHHSYPQQHNFNSIAIGTHCVVVSSRWVLVVLFVW